MHINYCLPIIKNNKEEIFEIIEKNISEYQYFEVWLDYIEELDETFLAKLTSLLQNKHIMLLRRNNLEPIRMDLQKRFDIISLISISETLLDLDISQKEELEHITKNELNINLILSYHNYEKTPSDDELTNIILDMEKYKPAIYKIATVCQNENDALRLLQLQSLLKEQNKKHIILGMGKFGTITRVYGTLWGNEMIFAPKTLDEQSAEGQLTKQELEKIFEVLTYGR
jgi:3-dehydroquinate dehydratase I